MKKMNNKGFSLVELIVVVLIMAIIAVALAPQVMKWVDNSRRSTDEDNYNEMMANAQVALTDKTAYADVYTAGSTDVKYNLYTNTSGTKLYEGSGQSTEVTSGGFYNALTNVSANWTTIKKKVTDSTPAGYQLNICKDGSVKKVVNMQPIMNADLS